MKLLVKRSLLSIGIAGGVLVGCSDNGDDNPTSPSGGGGGGTTDTIVNFSTDIQPIMQAKGCNGPSCHGSAMQGGLALGAMSHSNVVAALGDNGPFVVPGFPDSSNFYLKVSPNPPFGSRMPATGDYLTSAQIELVRRWIEQGAQDN